MDITSSVKKIAQDALVASRLIARLSSDVKNAALLRMADELTWRSDFIISENNRDVSAAREKGLSAAMIDRLTVGSQTIHLMAQGLARSGRPARSGG